MLVQSTRFQPPFARTLRSAMLALALFSALSMQTLALQFAPPFDVDAQAVYVVNQETGAAIYEKNAQEKIFPASTTKIMTVLLTLEHVADLSAPASYRPELFSELDQLNKSDYAGMLSMANLLPGETLSIEKLIYGAMLPSGNECAYILADYVGADTQEFVRMMNERAQELQMHNTHFSNPAGLEDDQNYSTAYDMYLLTKQAMQNPLFQQVASTAEYQAGPTDLHESLLFRNTNRTLFPDTDYYYPPIYGVKTGTLDSAGRCFISAAQQDGISYFTVMMKAPYLDENGSILPYNASFEETKSLYEWIFSALDLTQVVAKGQEWGEIPIQLGGKDTPTLKVLTDASFESILPKGTSLSSLEVEERYPAALFAPIQAGAPVGEMTLSFEGETLCTIPLVSAQTVERDLYQYICYQAANTFDRYGVWIAAAAACIVAVALACVAVHKRSTKQK